MIVPDPANRAKERNYAHAFIGYGGFAAIAGALGQWGPGAAILVGGILAFILGLSYILQPDT